MSARGTNWSTIEVEFLIAVWQENKVLEIMDSKRKNTAAYEIMSQKMVDAGFIRNKEQVQAKVKTLRQTYDRAKDRMCKSGESRDTAIKICPHFEELDIFLGSKPLSSPHYMVRSTDLPQTKTSSKNGSRGSSTSLTILNNSGDEADDAEDHDVDEEFASIEPMEKTSPCSSQESNLTNESNAPNSRCGLHIPGKEKRKCSLRENDTDIVGELRSQGELEKVHRVRQVQYMEKQLNIQEKEFDLKKIHLEKSATMQQQEHDILGRWLENNEKHMRKTTDMLELLVTNMITQQNVAQPPRNTPESQRPLNTPEPQPAINRRNTQPAIEKPNVELDNNSPDVENLITESPIKKPQVQCPEKRPHSEAPIKRREPHTGVNKRYGKTATKTRQPNRPINTPDIFIQDSEDEQYNHMSRDSSQRASISDFTVLKGTSVCQSTKPKPSATVTSPEVCSQETTKARRRQLFKPQCHPWESSYYSKKPQNSHDESSLDSLDQNSVSPDPYEDVGNRSPHFQDFPLESLLSDNDSLISPIASPGKNHHVQPSSLDSGEDQSHHEDTLFDAPSDSTDEKSYDQPKSCSPIMDTCSISKPTTRAQDNADTKAPKRVLKKRKKPRKNDVATTAGNVEQQNAPLKTKKPKKASVKCPSITPFQELTQGTISPKKGAKYIRTPKIMPKKNKSCMTVKTLKEKGKTSKDDSQPLCASKPVSVGSSVVSSCGNIPFKQGSTGKLQDKPTIHTPITRSKTKIAGCEHLLTQDKNEANATPITSSASKNKPTGTNSESRCSPPVLKPNTVMNPQTIPSAQIDAESSVNLPIHTQCSNDCVKEQSHIKSDKQCHTTNITTNFDNTTADVPKETNVNFNIVSQDELNSPLSNYNVGVPQNSQWMQNSASATNDISHPVMHTELNVCNNVYPYNNNQHTYTVAGHQVNYEGNAEMYGQAETIPNNIQNVSMNPGNYCPNNTLQPTDYNLVGETHPYVPFRPYDRPQPNIPIGRQNNNISTYQNVHQPFNPYQLENENFEFPVQPYLMDL